MAEMPPVDEFDSLALGSNLKEDFTGVIRDAQFVKSDRGDNWQLRVWIDADDGDEVEQGYGVGGDWASYDGGQTIEHPKGERTKINNQTSYAGWITAAVKSGAEEELRGRNRDLNNQGYRAAALWTGLRFHFDVVEVPGRTRLKVKNAEGVEVDEWQDTTYQRIYPTAFAKDGEQLTLTPTSNSSEPGDSQPAPTPQATSSSTPSTPQGASPAGQTGPLESLTVSDQTKLKLLAKTKTGDEFTDAILTFTLENGRGILELGDTMIAAISDGSLYKTLKG